MPGSWSGNVSKDTNSDNKGDKNLEGVEIKLYTDPNKDGDYSDGYLVATTLTDANGNYVFNNLTPDDYVAVETQPSNLDDVSEKEGGTDKDKVDNGIVNAIAGIVLAGEEDTGNDFIEKDKDTNSSTANYRIGDLFWIDSNKNGVYDSGEDVIPNAIVELLDTKGNVISSTKTDINGKYHFDVVAGEYKVRFKIPKDMLDNGYKFLDIRKSGDNTNKVFSDGVVENSVKVGPNIAQKNLTLDAAVVCSCSDIKSDKGASLGLFGVLLMLFGALGLGFNYTKREEIKNAVK